MTLADLNIFFKSSKLKSDISLFHFERKGAPIKIHVRFEAGSADDPESKQGLAHFLEHMMVVGTKSFPTKDLLSQALEKLGCSFGAFTNKETITIHFSIPSKNEIEPLKDIIREILFEPLFSEKVFEQERKAIISEIGEKNSNPAKYIWELYGKVFFKESPHGQSTLGTAESLQKIKLEDLKNYYKKILSSSRIALLSAGDVSIEKLASAFETLPFAHQHAEEVEYREGKVESITENFKTEIRKGLGVWLWGRHSST